MLKHIPGVRIAGECRDVDQNPARQALQLIRIVVVENGFEIAASRATPRFQPALNLPEQGCRPLAPQVEARVPADHLQHDLKRLGRLIRSVRRGPRA
jgi:hypothetical protein